MTKVKVTETVEHTIDFPAELTFVPLLTIPLIAGVTAQVFERYYPHDNSVTGVRETRMKYEVRYVDTETGEPKEYRRGSLFDTLYDVRDMIDNKIAQLEEQQRREHCAEGEQRRPFNRG